MDTIIQSISGSWHWSVSGALIALTMFLLLFAGKEFGVSSNLSTFCTIAGAGKRHAFFKFDWKTQQWNLLFIGGAIIGGYLAFFVFPNPEPVQISASTIAHLEELGISAPSSGGFTAYLPAELFATKNMLSIQGLITLIGGGFLIGFGTRWAGGCTSGHAISGLSNLQLPSLIAVIGFFIGGLLMSWFFLPILLNL
ncbi:MAG: YeeE/YedE thiosulfate transporter family protein [Bacteroidota bacterium]